MRLPPSLTIIVHLEYVEGKSLVTERSGNDIMGIASTLGPVTSLSYISEALGIEINKTMRYAIESVDSCSIERLELARRVWRDKTGSDARFIEEV